MNSDKDVGLEDKAYNQHSSSSQSCSLLLSLGLCAGHSYSSTPRMWNKIFMDLTFATVVLKQKNFATRLEVHSCLQYMYNVALTVPFMGSTQTDYFGGMSTYFWTYSVYDLGSKNLCHIISLFKNILLFTLRLN